MANERGEYGDARIGAEHKALGSRDSRRGDVRHGGVRRHDRHDARYHDQRWDPRRLGPAWDYPYPYPYPYYAQPYPYYAQPYPYYAQPYPYYAQPYPYEYAYPYAPQPMEAAPPVAPMPAPVETAPPVQEPAPTPAPVETVPQPIPQPTPPPAPTPTAPPLGTGQCEVRSYSNVTSQVKDALLKRLHSEGMTVSGNNPWDIDTRTHGVKLRAAWDPTSQTLKLIVTAGKGGLGGLVTCAAIWEKVDPIMRSTIAAKVSGLPYGSAQVGAYPSRWHASRQPSYLVTAQRMHWLY